MARSFASTSDYLTQGSAAIPTTGMASLWVYPTWAYNDGVEHEWVRVRNDSGGIKLFDITKSTDHHFFVGWYSGGVDDRHHALASSLVQNAWNHLLATWTNGGTTAFYLNGAAQTSTLDATSTATWNTAGTTRYLGVDGVSTPALSAASRMAEWAVWDAVGSAAHIAALAAGDCPAFVLPGNLVDYLPIFGDSSPEPNYFGSGVGTVTGTTQVAHPREFVRPAARPQIVRSAAAAGNRRRRVIVCGGVG